MPNPFVHVELNTPEMAASKKFYKGLFKWKLPTVMEGYTGIVVGEGTGGGMGAPAPGTPTRWLPYVEVSSVKRTIAKAKKLGAVIKVEYMPIGAMGAIGVFVDPQGAELGIWEPSKATKAAAALAAAAAAAPAAKKAAPKKAAAAAKKVAPKKAAAAAKKVAPKKKK